MTKNLKQFINGIDYLISKSFFYLQSRFTSILKDFIYSIFFTKCIKSNFKIIMDAACFAEMEIDKLRNVKYIDRGNSSNASKYSSAAEIEYIPDIIKSIIAKHRDLLGSYLGDDFLFEKPLLFRNYSIPEEMHTYDIYSNIWHQDSHDGYKLLKIFVLIHDVTIDDGPFIFLNSINSRKHWNALCNRWDFGKITKLPRFEEEVQLCGKTGDYLIINTATDMHRASIPKKYRDILQISLYPSWRKNNYRYVYND